MQNVSDESNRSNINTLSGVPEGFDALYLGKFAKQSTHPIIHIVSDDLRLEQLYETLNFFAKDVEVMRFPAWDCLPYDRVSPNSEIMGERLKTLTRLINRKGHPKALIVLTTAAAITQKIPARDEFKSSFFSIKNKESLDIKKLQDYLSANGYHRTETVREAGEYAIRGGLVDIFPAGSEEPLRIDCFGDDIENIKTFDALSQRTLKEVGGINLYPISEVILSKEAIENFRKNYRQNFGAARSDDALYESISNGRIYAGMEHWLPFFYNRLETLFDYLPNASITLDHQAEQALTSRIQQIVDLYQARMSMLNADVKSASVSYKPVHLESLYLSAADFHEKLTAYEEVIKFSPFPPVHEQKDAGGRKGRDFGDIRAQSGTNLYSAIASHILQLQINGKKVLITAYSQGSKDRITHLLQEQGLKDIDKNIEILGLEHGFETEKLAVMTEQDLLGDRLSRSAKKKKKSDAFLFEISQLNEGDYVVHEEHGIGQFQKLETVVVDGIPHDCLRLLYLGGDKLFIPVENLDILSRYGSGDAGATLDKLGGSAWQARKAKAKKDLLILANKLMEIAATRILKKTNPIEIESHLYEKFVSGFPYPETEDQLKAINDVLEHLANDSPMDRLVCGDVGFGKTEVALRAAAVAALSGYQVALIAPTTLLARQHYQTFQQRFYSFPIRIGLLSRFVSEKDKKLTYDGLEKGDVNIVIGTHALLNNNIKFNNLALLVIDEEQKFGVKQKERIKELKEDVHVLTLTATPIPRTLQMALTGVRELSLITTAPIDRLAVKTFTLPYDSVVIRDALMREHYRGGQSFYVCPRIADIAKIEDELRHLVPELKMIVAHGQMGAEEIEDKMSSFYEGKYDVLLSTNIVESGLDIPNANTIILHRSEMFGLAQLYQLRGRVGRSKQRAYAYFTFDHKKPLTKTAEQRLHVIEQLDSLGAGFQLASHDLDIRGAGNLLGEEQSGHIKEIGVELYQEMLEEAVVAVKHGGTTIEETEHWSPHINLGMPVMIPESYIQDLNLRLSIYRRIADLKDKNEIEGFAAELIDRFGKLPQDVENLLKLVEIKQLCRQVGIDKLEAGPKGAVMSFHPSTKINIEKLVEYISKQLGTVKLRPEDQKLVFIRAWDDIDQRLKGSYNALNKLLELC